MLESRPPAQGLASSIRNDYRYRYETASSDSARLLGSPSARRASAGPRRARRRRRRPRPASCTWWRRRTSGATSPSQLGGQRRHGDLARSRTPTPTPTSSRRTRPTPPPWPRPRSSIENGAGYDTWMSSLLGADGGQPAHRQRGDGAPRHRERPQPAPLVRHPARADRGGRHRGRAREGGAAGRARPSRPNLAAFDASLAPLDATLADHQGAASTTRRSPTPSGCPGYALAVAGLDVKTPPGFARAIEDGIDPGPADTLAMQRLLDDHDINVLLYNVQTVTPVTDADPRPGPPARHPGRRRLRDDAGRRRHLPAVAAVPADQLLHALESSRNP